MKRRIGLNYTIYLKDFKIYLLKEKHSSVHTIESYIRDTKQFFEFCSRQEINYLNKITKSNIISYLLFLQKQGRATATISRHLASLRGLFQYLFYKEYIKSDPTLNLETPKIEKRIPQTLSIKEIDILLNMPDITTTKGIRDRAILEVLYATGLRVTELICLKIDHVNIKKRNIICNNGNNGDSVRVIPLGKIAVQSLEKYINNSRKYIITDANQDILFVNMKGNQMTRQGLWKIIKYYTQKSNIKKSITPHMIRHSCALHLIENGANLQSVQEILGHSDISSTQIYTKTSNLNIDEIYKHSHPRA